MTLKIVFAVSLVICPDLDFLSDMSTSAIPFVHLYERVFNAASNGLVVLDANERIVLWNNWMSRHSGIAEAEAAGKSLVELFPEMINGRLVTSVHNAIRNGGPALLSQSLNKSPFPLFSPASGRTQLQRIQQAIQVTPLILPDVPRHCLVQVTDVTLSVARERMLRDQAIELRAYSNIDSLTNIANRRRLDEYLGNELRRSMRQGSSLAVIMLDIDYFKRYNDTYGHQMGDQCLMRVAAALASTVNRPGDLVARFGGEEFVAILTDANKEGGAIIAERMRAKIESLAIEHCQSGVASHITISLGVASDVPGRSCDPGLYIKAADQALYQSKQDGRNCVRVYNPELLCGMALI